MIANNEDRLSFLLRLGQKACIFGLGNASASIVPFSCGGASDAPQLAARVRRRRFTSLRLLSHFNNVIVFVFEMLYLGEIQFGIN